MKERVSNLTYPTLQHRLKVLHIMNANATIAVIGNQTENCKILVIFGYTSISFKFMYTC